MTGVTRTALLTAIWRDDKEEALRLIEAGADVEAVNEVGVESGGACGGGGRLRGEVWTGTARQHTPALGCHARQGGSGEAAAGERGPPQRAELL